MPKLLCSLRETQSPNLPNEQLGLRALCISEHSTKLYCDQVDLTIEHTIVL